MTLFTCEKKFCRLLQSFLLSLLAPLNLYLIALSSRSTSLFIIWRLLACASLETSTTVPSLVALVKFLAPDLCIDAPILLKPHRYAQSFGIPRSIVDDTANMHHLKARKPSIGHNDSLFLTTSYELQIKMTISVLTQYDDSKDLLRLTFLIWNWYK